MPSTFFNTRGPALRRTPSYRQQAQRRRLLVVCAILALALVSGAIGSLVRPAGPSPAVANAPGPFSYFPGQ